jgi:hypothetical protein
MKPLACLAIAVLLIACGGRETADDKALHDAIAKDRNGSEVTFHATATDNPVESGGHELVIGRFSHDNGLAVGLDNGVMHLSANPERRPAAAAERCIECSGAEQFSRFQGFKLAGRLGGHDESPF